MKIAFFSNSLNHHQVYIADEFYRILGNDYIFVATLSCRNVGLKGGADYSQRPYCLLAGDSGDAHSRALQLARDSEICIFGACSQEYAVERAMQQHCGLSFEVAERWLKHGWLTLGSSVFRTWLKNYYLYYRKKPFYKLCSSAFAARDDEKLFAYVGRHYKWAYFSSISQNLEIKQNRSGILRMMWCARFLKLKHPELPLKLAYSLKKKNYNFCLDYYGSGEEELATKKLAQKLGLDDLVVFHGMLPNALILNAMQEHDIFLFTSNRYEGWGTVVNEAMSNGCCVVGANKIGSIPYLIQHKVNGMIFEDGRADSLLTNVEWLFTHQEKLFEMRKKARETVTQIWSAKNAAENLLKLISDLQENRICSIIEGPASIAPIL